MKILYFDLENTPILGRAWGTYNTDLLSIEKYSELLSVAYKLDDGPTKVVSRREYTERQLTKLLWGLFNDADVIVGQNGDKFDIKVANKFFIKYRMKPPAPYKTVDTLKLAKKHFRFDSNKLDYLAHFLFGEKKHHTNYGLWDACMRGETKALVEMEEYNKQDVDLLYKLYQHRKAGHTGHPSSNVYLGTTHQCPVCGGNTQRRGFMVTRTGKYQRYQCTTCAAWSKGSKITSPKVIS